MFNPKSRALDKLGDRAIEMTAASEPPPSWSEAILPPTNRPIGRTAMFDKEEATVRPEHTAQLSERQRHVGNTAQRPRGNHRINALVVQRNSSADAFSRRIEGVVLRVARTIDSSFSEGSRPTTSVGVRPVEGEIQTGANADLENATFGTWDQSTAISREGSWRIERWMRYGSMRSSYKPISAERYKPACAYDSRNARIFTCRRR